MRYEKEKNLFSSKTLDSYYTYISKSQIWGVLMKKDKLQLIAILILTAFIISCSKEVKEPAEEKKSAEAKVETVQQNEVKSDSSTKTEPQSKETKAKEEADLKTKNLTEKLAEESKTYLLRNLNGGPSSGFMSRSTPYRSNDEHYYKEGSLLFYK